MALERPADALSMYERNLKKEPNRLKSVYGVATLCSGIESKVPAEWRRFP